MIKRIAALALVGLLGMCSSAWGAQCTEVFPSALANASSTGTISMISGAEIYNTPHNRLVTHNLDQDSATGCGPVACVKSDTVSVSAQDFTNFPSATAEWVPYQTSRSYTPRHFGSFQTGTLSTVNFAPGEYTINGNLVIGSDSVANVSSPGTVRLYVAGSVELGANVRLNTDGDSNRAVFIYTRSTFTLQSAAKATAVVYAKGGVMLHNLSHLTGAISSEAAISMQSGAALTYSATQISTTDFGSSCVSRALAEFVFDVASTASTCAPHRVTITAMDNRGDVFDIYAGSIRLTTSSANGEWNKTTNPGDAFGTLDWTSNDSGVAAYQFVADDNGTVTLALANSHKETLVISSSDAAAGVSSNSVQLDFADNAFIVEPVDALADDVIAGRSHQFQASMMRKDASGACAVAQGYNVASVKAWLQRAGEDPGGVAPQLVAGNSVALPDGEPAAANASLNFAAGVANFSLQADDVGKYTLRLQDSSNEFADVPIIGGSSMLIARPFGLAISTPGNPSSSSADGAVFSRAGEPFDVNVQAVAWQAADDADQNGHADGHDDNTPETDANLTDNPVLASFGHESVVVNVHLQSALQLPAGGANPSLAGATVFAARSGSTQVRFDEVGIIQLRAGIDGSSYLGSSTARGSKISSTSGYVGRFVPAQLKVSEGAVTAACTSALDFTYLDQHFTASFRVTAVNLLGATTSNYIDDFAKLQKNDIHDGLGAIDTDTAATLSERLLFGTGNVYSWQAGVLEADSAIGIAREGSEQAPFIAELAVAFVDSDGVAQGTDAFDTDIDANGVNDSQALGSTALRFGRLRLDDSFGPETADLPVRFATEYWDGFAWQDNLDDSCTTLGLTEISYPEGNIAVVANRTVAIGAGSTTGNYGSLVDGRVSFSAGSAQHFFSAPGRGNTGKFQVQVATQSLPWLQFDWNGDGDHSDSALPPATYTFGAYRGHDRVLYWFEELE